MVDLQTLPKVLPAMEEIEFLVSSRMLPTSLGKPCHSREHESVIKDDQFWMKVSLEDEMEAIKKGGLYHIFRKFDFFLLPVITFFLFLLCK